MLVHKNKTIKGLITEMKHLRKLLEEHEYVPRYILFNYGKTAQNKFWKHIKYIKLLAPFYCISHEFNIQEQSQTTFVCLNLLV